jgi:hypothetical protein
VIEGSGIYWWMHQENARGRNGRVVVSWDDYKVLRVSESMDLETCGDKFEGLLDDY